MVIGEVSRVLVGAEEDWVVLIVGRLSNLQGVEFAEECHMLQCRLDQWHALQGQSDMWVFISRLCQFKGCWVLKHAATQIHKRAQLSEQIKQFYPRTGCDLQEGVHAISCPPPLSCWPAAMACLCGRVSCVAGAMFPPKHRASLSHRVKG